MRVLPIISALVAANAVGVTAFPERNAGTLANSPGSYQKASRRFAATALFKRGDDDNDINIAEWTDPSVRTPTAPPAPRPLRPPYDPDQNGSPISSPRPRHNHLWNRSPRPRHNHHWKRSPTNGFFHGKLAREKRGLLGDDDDDGDKEDPPSPPPPTPFPHTPTPHPIPHFGKGVGAGFDKFSKGRKRSLTNGLTNGFFKGKLAREKRGLLGDDDDDGDKEDPPSPPPPTPFPHTPTPHPIPHFGKGVGAGFDKFSKGRKRSLTNGPTNGFFKGRLARKV